MSAEPEKSYNPNIWGAVTGLASLLIFSVAYATLGFPSMLIHVLILPIVIGLIVRWQIKLNFTNSYRDD